MNIGIDTDGVLTDLYGFNYEIGTKVIKQELINPSGYNLKEMYGVKKSWELFHGLKCFFEYSKNWPPREKAPEMIRQLKNDGHRLNEITARKFVTMKNPLGWYSKYLLKKWYDKYEMKFDEIILCSEKNAPEEKLKGCIQTGCKVMIEDKPDVAELLAANGIQILLFDAPYNQLVKGENITRVYNWEDVYEELQLIANEQ